jgi:hypothetical protein
MMVLHEMGNPHTAKKSSSEHINGPQLFEFSLRLVVWNILLVREGERERERENQ